MPATDPVQAVAEVMRTHLWSHAARSCSCGWEQKRKGAPFLRQWTEHVAEAAVAAARPLIAAEALREAAEAWRTDEPQRSTYAHARFFARELDNRADRIEADQ